ncbi:MAG: hypothetical protein QG578_502 [Thermodesulfobacteriota bacterium]|nr:hypothetical protein [Thermodesulfobacteriota bacterium]
MVRCEGLKKVSHEAKIEKLNSKFDILCAIFKGAKRCLI